MVVSGAVGLVDHYLQTLSTPIQLRDMTVIVDTTGNFYWYTKRSLLETTKSDKYGTSMPALGQFYRNLFKRLRERNVRPIIVYEGGRRSEREGPIVSKAAHLRGSASAALHRLNAGRLSTFDHLPQLAANCLKEVINEFDFQPDQLYQAECEVYPVLVDLARRHKCPVMTHHTDFIFQDVPTGFIRLDRIDLPTRKDAPIDCRIYWHSELLRAFNMEPEHSGALGCLPVLLRDDFAEVYYAPINRVLRLEQPAIFRLGPNVRMARVKTARLEHILTTFNKIGLTTADSVRAALVHQSQGVPHLTRDYDALRDCYSRAVPFEQSELARTLAGGLDDYGFLNDTLTRRESSLEFLTNLTQTNFNRTGIEDVSTHRSTFSLQDRVKEYIISRLRRKTDLKIFDRRRDRMELRPLRASEQFRDRLTNETLFGLFHFNERKLNRIATNLQKSIAIDVEHSERLALLLLLARFVTRIVPRENYSNSREDLGGPLSQTGSFGSDPNYQVNEYSKRETREKFFSAVLNSYIYLLIRTNQGDESRQNTPADMRVAQDKVAEIVKAEPCVHFSSSQPAYIIYKHLLEALNSTLHAYKEINSLYDFPGPNILVNKYYDAVIIYKLMARLSRSVQGYLLALTPDVLEEL